ncbi:Fc.00g105410.m01.CDS01 [Cosmosporella sp. VM-42]
MGGHPSVPGAASIAADARSGAIDIILVRIVYDPTSAGNSKRKEVELRGRLRRLEVIVDELGADLAEANSQHGSGTSLNTDRSNDRALPSVDGTKSTGGKDTAMQGRLEAPTDELAEELGKLIVGEDGTFYIRGRLWRVLADEGYKVKKIRQIFEEDHFSDSDMSQDRVLKSSPSRVPFVFGRGSEGENASQPLPSQVPFIWQTFVENVDPFMKILHIPTMSKVVRESKGKFNNLSSGGEALMFAISLATISSLTDSEVVDNFSTSKARLVTQLTLGVEQSLLRAGFLNTTDLNVVQAFVIYLEFAGYTYGSRATWIMTGLLVRTAISMGLHRDGSHFRHVSNFETEMRRRLWWHICFLDRRVCDGEASETSITEASFDTRDPANVDDNDIQPDMRDWPAIQDSHTDMTICLLRCQLWRLSCRVDVPNHPSSAREDSTPGTLEQRLETLSKSRDLIKKRFVDKLAVDEQTRTFIEIMVCLALTRCELVIHHMDLLREASNISNDTLGQKYFLISVTSFEHTQALKLQPLTQKWAWIFNSCIPWHSIGIILTQLCILPWGPKCEKAWTLVKQTIDDIPEAATKNAPQHPIQHLMATAHNHRDEEIRRLLTQPYVIQQLTQLAVSRPAAPPIFQCSNCCIGFDTSVAESQLALEKAASIGAGSLLPVPNDSGLTDHLGMIPEWLGFLADLHSFHPENNTSSFCLASTRTAEQVTIVTDATSQPVPAEFAPQATLGNESGIERNLGFVHQFHPLRPPYEGFHEDEELRDTNTVDDETSWELWGEMLDKGDVPF